MSLSFQFKVGIGVKPKTEMDVIKEYISQVDMVLVMTVEPGYGGQAFMPEMMEKVKFLRQNHTQLDIQVDGGVGLKTIDSCADVSFQVIQLSIMSFSLKEDRLWIFSFTFFISTN